MEEALLDRKLKSLELTDETSSVLSSTGTNGHAMSKVLQLECDCYSIAAAKGTPPLLAVVLPLVAASFQVTVLYCLASTSRTSFSNGHWLASISTFGSVNGVKAVSIVISLFKVSQEYKYANQLYSALTGNAIQEGFMVYCGWLALLLQYVMATGVLVVSVNLVMAAESCAGAILKALAVFIVVDMDNVTARFVCLWFAVDFQVNVTSGRYMQVGAIKCCDAESSQSDLENFAVAGKDYVLPGFACFHMFPLLVFCAELAVAFCTGILPLTLASYGMVSNKDAPEVGYPPFLVQHAAGVADYRVLLLAPIGAPPPVVWWIGMKDQAESKSAIDSLQIRNGYDGHENKAFRHGSKQAVPVQAKYWLQVNNYTGSEYSDLIHKRLLYVVMRPYAVDFRIDNLETRGAVYRVSATAENPETRALAPDTLSSQLLVVNSRCEAKCNECLEWNPLYCKVCAGGMHWQEGTCRPCPDQCLLCRDASESCEPEGCRPGYGTTPSGSACLECAVPSCNNCDGDNSTCNSCAMGFSLFLNSSGGFCLPCNSDCLQCDPLDQRICLRCRPGFADVPETMAPGVFFGTTNRTICTACSENCRKCSADGTQWCHECSFGYGFQGTDGPCKKCDDHIAGCTNCSWDDSGTLSCHRCREGLGMSPTGECLACGADCHICDSAGLCNVCEDGFALAQAMKEESQQAQKGVVHGHKCLSCADNCRSCRTAGPSSCDVCDSGYQMNNSTNMCEAASSSINNGFGDWDR